MNNPTRLAITVIKRLSQITVLCLLGFSLFACSGGISGTGDGDEVILIEGGNTGASPVESNNSDVNPVQGGTTAPTDTATDGTASQLGGAQNFPQQIIVPISNGLNSDYLLQERLAAPPVTHLISRQLNIVSSISNQLAAEVPQLEALLVDSINQCGNTCLLSEGSVTATTSPITTIDSLELASYTYYNVSYANQQSGYYDQSLTYTRDDGTEIFVRWSNDRKLVFTLTASPVETSYVLTDLWQSTTTLRYENKTESTSFHAIVVNDPQGNSTVEADWHGSTQVYIRALANASSTTLFSIDPADPSATRFREYITQPQLSYTIDSCSSQSIVCDNWISVLNDATPSNPFSAVQNTIGDFSASLTSTLQPTIPADINEYVLSEDTIADTNQPEPKSLLCAGQRVINRLRTFCWQPLPLEVNAAVFEEIHNSGGYSYRRLPNVTF